MGTTIAALASNSIRYAEFVQITTPSEIVTLTNSVSTITVNGITFTGMGSYMGIGDIQQDIKATSTDMKIMITGINPDNIAFVLSSNLKGSTVKIWRGFLDSDNQIQTIGGVQQFFLRYSGIINNISIDEKFNLQVRDRIATCVMACASFREVLNNRVAGIKTNPSNWRFLYPTDTSMDRVPIIASTYFDFGQPPSNGSQSKVLGSTSSNPVALVKFS